jgi:hypothetical protein
MLTAPFYQQPVVGDITEIQNHPRELLRQTVGHVRDFCDSYLIKTAEGFGKTSSHFYLIEDEMLDIAMALPWGSPEPFACFACRSYQQAEQKANEFRRKNPGAHWAVVIKSFKSIYRNEQ